MTYDGRTGAVTMSWDAFTKLRKGRRSQASTPSLSKKSVQRIKAKISDLLVAASFRPEDRRSVRIHVRCRSPQ
jgi:hypothetical protein